MKWRKEIFMPSERDYLAAREFREFVREEEEKQRVNEDAEEYQKYVAQVKSEQQRLAPAERIKPLTFSKWRECIPAELRDAPPVVRGGAATATACMRTLATVAIDRLKRAELTDQELATLGFDPEGRMLLPEVELSVPVLVDIFTKFNEREPRYRKPLHYGPITDFLLRNNLILSERNVELIFNHLLGVGAIALPEPEPEPVRPTGVNEFGVNLSMAPNPEVEKRKQWERYTTAVVCTDPETGKGYTEYMLDRVDSENYRRLMRIPRNTEFRPEPQR